MTRACGTLKIGDNSRAKDSSVSRLMSDEDRFRNLFLSSPDAIFVEDSSGRVKDANPAACHLHGLSRSELIGSDIVDLVPVEDRDKVRDSFTELLRGQLGHLQGYSLHKSGRKIPVEIRVTNIDYEGGPAILLHVRDITEQHRLANELRKAKENAEHANRTKDRFLAHISHDLRTPLGGIVGLTDRALECEPDVRTRDCLHLIRSSAESLLSLISDLLDHSQVAAGKMRLERKEFSLREALRDLVLSVDPLARKKNLQLRWSVAEGIEDRIVCDPRRLRQVLTNLLGNAIKFTEHGEIMVVVHRSPTREGFLQFAVADTGTGIPAEKKDQIFDAFVSLENRSDSTGLGLAICHGLVGLMGGEVWLQSELGKGTTVFFTIPYAASDINRCESEVAPVFALSSELQQPREIKGLRVLVADDSAVYRLLIGEQLNRLGHEPTVVESGSDLIAAWAAGDFDVAIVDIKMPGLSGIEATQQIRARESVKRMPIIGLTGLPSDSCQQECCAAGMDRLQNKPIQIDLLRTLLSECCRPAVVKSTEG